jgi:hypothetical protein
LPLSKIYLSKESPSAAPGGWFSPKAEAINNRYQPFNYRIGKLTEYFAFPFVKTVLQDLYEMEPKVLSAVELDAKGDGGRK